MVCELCARAPRSLQTLRFALQASHVKNKVAAAEERAAADALGEQGNAPPAPATHSMST